jgi:hypothetical protein
LATQIQIKRGSTTPAGLTVGESAMNTSTNQIYLGGTGGTVLVGGEVTGGVDMGAGSAVSANRIPTQSGVYNYVRNSTVTSFNGLTGAVGGVCAAQANTFTALQTFTAGISASEITVGGLITNISNDSGSAFNPIIDLYRNSASPASSDSIGQILFNGKDSAGNKQQYVNIHSAILDPSTTVESGQFHIETSTSGAMTEKMRIGAGGLIINNPQGNFNTIIYGQGDTMMFVAQGSTDRVGIGTSTPSVKLDVVGSIKASGGLSAGAGSFTGTLTGVTANFSGLVSASSGISASALTVSGGVTFSGNVYLGDNATGVTAASNDFVRILAGTNPYGLWNGVAGIYQSRKNLSASTSGVICATPEINFASYTTVELMVEYAETIAYSGGTPWACHKFVINVSSDEEYSGIISFAYTESITKTGSVATVPFTVADSDSGTRIEVTATVPANSSKFYSGWRFKTTMRVY